MHFFVPKKYSELNDDQSVSASSLAYSSAAGGDGGDDGVGVVENDTSLGRLFGQRCDRGGVGPFGEFGLVVYHTTGPCVGLEIDGGAVGDDVR